MASVFLQKKANVVKPFIYLISTSLSGNPCIATWREFRIQEWISLHSCQYQTFPLYSSLPLVISEEFINSQSKGVYAQPWFGFLFPANTIWIPKATTQWKCIIHSCCPYFHHHEGVVLPLSVNQGQSGMFVHHSLRIKEKLADLVHRKYDRAHPIRCWMSLSSISQWEIL